jgi:hypothetical protein
MERVMPSANRGYADGDIRAETEGQVEKLVAEIGGVIRAAEPERRAGLKEMAETLLHEEVATIAEEKRSTETEPRRLGSNPLAAGILLTLLGLGFLLMVPLIGITLTGIGVLLALSGAVMSWFRK